MTAMHTLLRRALARGGLALGLALALAQTATAAPPPLDYPASSDSVAGPDSRNDEALTAPSPPPPLSVPPPPRAVGAASPEPWYRLRAVAELGFISVLYHHLQFGRTGADFDARLEGAQDNLYAFSRFSVEAAFFRRHQVVLLYQPIDIATRTPLRRDVRVDDLVFPSGTALALRYGFPFYRGSYAYDLLDRPGRELSVGVSLQIRDATIEFASADGKLLRSSRNVGPVPLLRSRGRYTFAHGAFVGYEVDAIYSPIGGANGRKINAALVDLSLRAGVALPLHTEAFLNLRYLGGGVTSDGPPKPPDNDGYTSDWLHTITLSVGAAISSF
jgi:hypothetical protein